MVIMTIHPNETEAERKFDAVLDKARRYPCTVIASSDHKAISARWRSVVDHVSFIQFLFYEDRDTEIIIRSGTRPDNVIRMPLEDFDALLRIHQEIL